MDKSVRVVVADDDLLVRRGIVAVLETMADIEVVAEAGSLTELLEFVGSTSPDVLITDIRMPPTLSNEGIDAVKILRETGSDIGILVLSQHLEPEYVLAVFEAGTTGIGYLLKENVGEIESLHQAILSVNNGGSVVDPAVVDVLVESRSSKPSTIDALTSREREVMGKIAEGLNNSAIADRLVLSERAVAKHINSIFAKLHLRDEADSHSRVRAVLLWLAATD